MIYADIHEPPALIDILKKNITVKVIKNDAGDYIFDDTAIERKTLSDFFSSVVSGRLYTQLERMMNFRSYLFVEGFFDFSYVNNPGCLYSSLRSITIDMDVRVIFTKDIVDTASTIKRIYYSRFHQPRCKVPDRGNPQFSHLKAFFGTSPGKLTKLLAEFKSLRQLANADRRTITAIRGIGGKTASVVEKALDQEILNNNLKSHKHQ
ncbi:hypothetical protein HY640_04340 [Candidatus Woesearchaeota archaeon]|nr:hypothetical protein [Candidatus Woesearchaeota archaeon]